MRQSIVQMLKMYYYRTLTYKYYRLNYDDCRTIFEYEL